MQKYWKSILPQFFQTPEYGAAISELIGSGLLTPVELANLVALSHSGAGAALIDVIPPGTDGPFKFIIMIEPIFLNRDKNITKIFDSVHKLVKRADAKAPASWPSIDAATTYLFKRMPWRSFDAANRRILVETFFRPTDGGVTTKTPTKQRTASFGDLESGYANTERVVKLLPNIGFHSIMSGVEDLWPPPMANAIRAKTEELKSLGLGVTIVEGVGHHLPHENPEACAKAIFGALSRVPKLKAKL